MSEIKHLRRKIDRVRRRLKNMPKKKRLSDPTPEEIRRQTEAARLRRFLKTTFSMRIDPADEPR